MCGRFTLTATPDTLQETLNLGTVPTTLEPRYNIAPTQSVAVVTDPGTRDVALFRWGLVPSWADDPSIGNKLINARAETVAEKPSFRSAFRSRRCLILADGFYEWQKRNGKKGKQAQPFYFRLESGEPFAFAGLWETWQPSEGADPLLTCTLITCAANERVAPIHDRNPVILDGDKPWVWLDPAASREQLHALLVPYPADEMMAYPVSSEVNSPHHDNAALLHPLAL